uniref:NADH dehydrogenase subunit 2 n=1 Tax=Potamyia chinensis TaxID=1875907 RepID=UPI00223894AD|nr:NADH dehydrogenase subunit 2 [Potamyia chinensis]UYO79415.1 NADH dehydrogenase subunit 2 [Potamyia chinensis]
MNYSKILFFSLMIFSNLISISSNSWLLTWMGLEINTLSFLTFVYNKNNIISNEMSIKYFMIQSISSINLMFFIFLLNLNYSWNIFFNLNNVSEILILISLLFKVGSAPFHFWMINLVDAMKWKTLFIFFTIQKIPLLILITYYMNNKLMLLMIILNCFFGSIGGLNVTNTRKIITYSSIYNFSWMLSSLMINEILFFMFMVIYSILLLNLIFMFHLMNLNNLNQLFIFKTKNLLTFSLMISLLSLAGLPPFLGFLGKWMISFLFIQLNNFFILIVIMFSLINLYYYIQLFYPIIFLNKIEIKWINNLNYKINYKIKIWLSLFLSLFSISLMLFMFMMF